MYAEELRTEIKRAGFVQVLPMIQPGAPVACLPFKTSPKRDPALTLANVPANSEAPPELNPKLTEYGQLSNLERFQTVQSIGRFLPSLPPIASNAQTLLEEIRKHNDFFENKFSVGLPSQSHTVKYVRLIREIQLPEPPEDSEPAEKYEFRKKYLQENLEGEWTSSAVEVSSSSSDVFLTESVINGAYSYRDSEGRSFARVEIGFALSTGQCLNTLTYPVEILCIFQRLPYEISSFGSADTSGSGKDPEVEFTFETEIDPYWSAPLFDFIDCSASWNPYGKIGFSFSEYDPNNHLYPGHDPSDPFPIFQWNSPKDENWTPPTISESVSNFRIRYRKTVLNPGDPFDVLPNPLTLPETFTFSDLTRFNNLRVNTQYSFFYRPKYV